MLNFHSNATAIAFAVVVLPIGSLFQGDVACAQMIDIDSSSNTYLVPFGFETQIGHPSPWRNSSSSDSLSMNSEESNRALNEDRRQFIQWNSWGSTSYFDDEYVCRENAGNLVCLTHKSASYLRW